MKNNFTIEIIISILLISILVFFVNPLDLLMPHAMHPFMVPILILLFVVFTSFLWREQPGDERDQFHKYISSRFAYFAGVGILIIGIVAQSMTRTIDSWLVISICVILLAKIIGTIYANKKH